MNSQDIYKQAVGVAREEQGTETYDRMQETYRNSLQGRTKALQAEIESVFNNLFTTENFYPLIDSLTNIVQLFDNLTQAVGGGSNALNGFILLIGQQFSQNIARGISSLKQNYDLRQMQEAQIEAIQSRSQYVISQGGNLGGVQSQKLDMALAKVGQHVGSMSPEQMESFAKSADEAANSLSQLGIAEEEFEIRTQSTMQVLGLQKEELTEMGYSVPRTKEELRNLLIEFEKIGEASPLAAENIESLTSKFVPLIQKVNQTQLKLRALSFEKITKDSAETREDIEGLAASLRKLKNAGKIKLGISDSEMNKITSAAEKLKQILKQDEIQLKELEEVLNSIQPVTQKVATSLQSVGESAYKNAREYQEAELSIENANHRVTTSFMELEAQANGMGFQVMTEKMIRLTMGVGQLAFAFESVQGLGSIFANEELSI